MSKTNIRAIDKLSLQELINLPENMIKDYLKEKPLYITKIVNIAKSLR